MPRARAPVTAVATATAGATLRGLPASPGLACGPAVIVTCRADLQRVAAGDVLVVPSAGKAWSAAFTTVVALVTESGGELAGGATLAREHGLSAVVGVPAATRVIADG